MAELSVEIRRKSYPAVGDAPEKLVLRGLRFTVGSGETVVVTGPSGCGKTTLLNIIAGLERDFEGRIERRAGTRIGYVFQEPRLLPWRTVEDNLRLVLEGEAAVVDRRIDHALGEVGLEGVRKVYASHLSLGMARRVAIARAFVVEPTLLLMDEPFVSLDEPTAVRLRRLLLELLERHATTTIFVTHNIREAIMLADRILFLSAAPSSVVSEVPVSLPRSARTDEAAIEDFRASLGDLGRLSELRPEPAA